MNFTPAPWVSTPCWSKPSKPSKSHETLKSNIVKPVDSLFGDKIVFILDESGSMQSIKNDIVGSINHFISKQKKLKTERPAYFSLVKFNETVNNVVSNIDLKQTTSLKEEDYRPNGCTALYDAIGQTIDRFRYETDVLLVVITDGEENSSKAYSLKQVKDMLEEKQQNRNWSYVYLCNDLSTEKQGNSLGFANSGYASNCCVQQDKYGSFLKSNLCEAVTNQRCMGISVQQQLNKN
jgi:hypothetical protein